MANPVGNNPGSLLKGWGQQEPDTSSPSPERFIVTANTNILLQIEDDGKVSGTKCKTENGTYLLLNVLEYKSI